MNLYLVFVILISLVGIKIFIKDFNKDFMEKSNTSAVKGFFVLMVFFSHAITYMKINPLKDGLMLNVRQYLGQLMVTMFMFYSGYGIFETIKKKKNEYIESIPKNRILKTLIHFDIAVIVFAAVRRALGVKYSIGRILLAFTGWVGIGNSNWYIFSILVLYIFTYFSFKLFEKDNKKALLLTWILTILSMMAINAARGPGFEYCFNTMTCYTLGMSYSFNKEKINKIIFNNKNYLIIFGLCLLFSLGIKRYEYGNNLYFIVNSFLFVFMVLLVTAKVAFRSPILKWFGDRVFPIYIFQRLPMLVLNFVSYGTRHAYRFFTLSFIITIIIAIIFDYLYKEMDKILFAKKDIKKA